jgi:hypothetical protein
MGLPGGGAVPTPRDRLAGWSWTERAAMLGGMLSEIRRDLAYLMPGLGIR